MTDNQTKYLIVGIAALIVLIRVMRTNSAKALSTDIQPNAIEPDGIERALTKLKTGEVKVNDTPEETKNAIGK
jgi:hypothetical protein